MSGQPDILVDGALIDWKTSNMAWRGERKPLSPARAAEFRGRRLKRLFGDRKARAERFARLRAFYGLEAAVQLSRLSLVETDGCNCPRCTAILAAKTA